MQAQNWRAAAQGLVQYVKINTIGKNPSLLS